ncbi:MAG TPA: hypothetical protein VNI84_04010 [Pyrinomonadaceae bacterium]|nr:hypothetical protein [Pyrinomonadaceae bacterium]
MTDSIQTPPNGTLVSNDLKKMLVVPAMTLIVAVVVAWYAAQQSQSELRFQSAANKEQIQTNAAAIKANSDAVNLLVISTARNADTMARLAEDLKEWQLEQRANQKK